MQQHSPISPCRQTFPIASCYVSETMEQLRVALIGVRATIHYCLPAVPRSTHAMTPRRSAIPEGFVALVQSTMTAIRLCSPAKVCLDAVAKKVGIDVM